jgi:DNA gyrase subunit B
VERARLDKMLANAEVRALVIAIGAAIGAEFDVTKARYHKIVIMTDADVDGAHIRTLLLTLFYRHFLPLIEAGYLYIAQPPLYRVQIGKEVNYAYSDGEKEKLTAAAPKTVTPSIQRYKGLGEMNPDQLWETTMDPERRVLLQVMIADAEAANHMFDVLMGEEVLPRKQFIQTHAASVQNLDV